MTRIRVLSPVGVATRDMVTVPPLPESLVGRTVGFLDNRKANFDRLADEIGRLDTRSLAEMLAVLDGRKPKSKE